MHGLNKEKMTVIQREVCVVVVLFNPQSEQINNVEALSSNINVAAIDNSEEASKVNCAYYVPLLKNLGIAAAQNVGIKYAKSEGFKYVLLLDQDSCVDIDFVYGLYNAFKNIEEFDSQVAYLGPVFIDKKSGQEYKNHSNEEKDFTKVNALIASGSMISLNAIDKVGMMDESLFIDIVDFEWCWRANSMGYTGYITRNVTMIHSIGKEYHNWHGFVIGISAPFRYYYQYRNTLWLCRRKYVPFKWKLKSILRRILDLCLVPIVSSEGKNCLNYMIKGISNGLFYKNTPYFNEI